MIARIFKENILRLKCTAPPTRRKFPNISLIIIIFDWEKIVQE